MDVRKNGHLQRELLRAAVDCCKPGGIIVYSTCSVSVEENEAVVDYITRIRHVKIRDTGLPIKKGGLVNYKEHRFNPKLALTRRVYPHVHNMDGFYIAKLQKIKDGERKVAESVRLSKPELSKKKAKKAKAAVGEDGKPAGPKVGNDGLTKKQRNKLAKKLLKKRKPEPVVTEETEAVVEGVTENTPEATEETKPITPAKPVKEKPFSHKLAKKKKLLMLKRKKLSEIRK